MRTDYSALRRRLDTRPKLAILQKALLHEAKLAFHTETEIQPTITQPINDFENFVKSLIPNDKYEQFEDMFRWPVMTNEITGIIFDRLSKIFSGQNPVFDYQFTNVELKSDWENYRAIINEPEVWQTKAWEVFKSKINSVLIVDMPSETTIGKPQPYFYFLDFANVLDYEVNERTQIFEYIVFRQEGKKIAVIDDYAYYLYDEDDGGNLGALLSENRHNLGYCPAKFFWDEPINLNTPDIKKSPLTKQLSRLDWYLFWELSKQNFDLSGAYPIYSGYEEECDYSEPDNDVSCDHGFLRHSNGEWLFDTAHELRPCPKCSKRRIAGPGSYVIVPRPDDNTPDMRNPIQMLSPDVASLNYNVEESERQKNRIIMSVCGVDSNLLNSEALNETQVHANFEDKTTILNRIKKGFEIAQKFVDSTICKLRYGSAFIGLTISYGTEFFQLSVDQLRERYKTAKEAGASISELDALNTAIIRAEYANNPAMLQRMLILSELEPFKHKNLDEVLQLFEKSLISQSEMALKLRFDELIARFERENINVVEFGNNAMSYKDKIETISKTLNDYVSKIQ